MITIIHKGKNFREAMNHFHERRAEYISQEIKMFDAETLYLLIETIKANGSILEQIIGLAV
nr:hypothetical protein NZ312_17215 [Clostridioides difficile]